METKATSDMCTPDKLDIRKENFCDNSKGSAFLFQARAGCSRTKSFVGKYARNNGVCVVCGNKVEIMHHIVLDREGIYPNLIEGNIRLTEALVFKGRRVAVNDVRRTTAVEVVEGTKRRL